MVFFPQNYGLTVDFHGMPHLAFHQKRKVVIDATDLFKSNIHSQTSAT